MKSGARRTLRADPDPWKSQAASSSRRLTPTGTRGGAARGNIKSEVPLGLHGRVPSASRVAAVVQRGRDATRSRPGSPQIGRRRHGKRQNKHKSLPDVNVFYINDTLNK